MDLKNYRKITRCIDILEESNIMIEKHIDILEKDYFINERTILLNLELIIGYTFMLLVLKRINSKIP